MSAVVLSTLAGGEILILVAVAVVIFGAGWLPKAARNLGKAKVEFDNVQQQFEQTKEQVVAASGVKELEKTVRKANKALNTTPQGMLKNAASSAMKPAKRTDEAAATTDENIEEAEIVDPAGDGSTHQRHHRLQRLTPQSLWPDRRDVVILQRPGSH